MAEVKNSFLKSKMNKDLDSRLIPNGEYRDAVNVQVSRSEGDDVGALQNVLGNFELSNIGDDLGYYDVKCIGYCVDDSKDDVYMFFTNYLDANAFGARPVFSTYVDDGGFSKYFHGIFVYNTRTSTLNKIVEGLFLNFSINKPILGVNLLEDVLFWTDDRNQPRKINVDKAKSNPTFYNSEDKISVAKYYPYQSPLLIKETDTSTPENPVYETTMYDASEELLPDSDTANPYYDPNFPGDPRYLEDKFVRFSYRFKFKDGEYSLIAPFTQPCFIPKQDGYFLVDDEKTTISSTVVSFMENKVNKIKLQIPLPYDAEDMESSLNIEEIDVVYKESDGISLKVVETIPVSDLSGSDRVYEYEYISQKPYKTLPGDEVSRVYDKVPVKALAQEVVSNRVVYANFQDKHTPPKSLNYQVAGDEKYEATNPEVDFNAKSTIEYPNHTLKENRNYQVGVVLSDRYGRQSTVILSNNKDSKETNSQFGADTLYLPYRVDRGVDNDSISFFGDSLKMIFNEKILPNRNAITGDPGLYSETNPLGWYSYKIVVKQLEQDYYNVYTSGAIKGNPEVNTDQLDSSFIVLINDNINKIPRDLSEVGPQDKSFRSSVRLFGRVENTTQGNSSTGNKQYFPGNRTFTTNVIEDLFDIFDVTDTTSNQPITDDTNPYYTFLRGESNPFIGEFITSQTGTDQFGVINQTNANNEYVKTENLAVLETAPTTSFLDIYYETSTSGLLSELNTAVDTGFDGAVGLNSFVYSHYEGDPLNHKITENFSFVDFDGLVLTPNPGTVNLTVEDSSGAIRTGDFTLVEDPNNSNEFFIETNSYFYFGKDAGVKEDYTFTLTCFTGGTIDPIRSAVIEVEGELQNTTPSIDNDNTGQIQVTIGKYLILDNIQGRNGSNDTNSDTETWRQQLRWSITNIPDGEQDRPDFELLTEGGSIRVVNNNPSADGIHQFTLNVQDIDAEPNTILASKVFTVNFDRVETDNVFTETLPYTIKNGGGAAVWFANNTTNLLSDNPFGTGSAFNTGIEAPAALGGSANFEICPNSFDFDDNRFINRSRYTTTDNSGALTKGYFYVFITLKNTFNQGAASGNYISNAATSIALSYRQDSGDYWSSAVDMVDVSSSLSTVGNWMFESPDMNGLYDDEGIYPPNTTPNTDTSSLVFPMTVATAGNTLGGTPSGSIILAFSIPGEYRLIMGNISTNYIDGNGDLDAIFSLDDEGNANINCGADATINNSANATIKIGDLYHLDDENIKRNSSSSFPDGNNKLSEGVYEYLVYEETDCDVFPDDPLTLYAREPFTKYVTQLYTNQTFTNTPSLPAGKEYKIGRIVYNDNVGSPVVYNPEKVKNGFYKIGFNVNGTRINTIFGDKRAIPCMYNNPYN